MLAKPKPKEENPNDEPPDPSQRYVNSSVVPIKRANSDIIEATTYTPPKARGPVVVPMKSNRKNRADFDSDVDWELWQIQQVIAAKIERETVEQLNEVRSFAEEKPLDPPTPLVGASSSPRNERDRLDAYLAHHNPSGSGKVIRTVQASVTIEGQPYSAPERQDRITTKEGVEKVTYCRLYRPRPVVEVVYNQYGHVVGRKILKWQTGSVEEDYKTIERKFKRSEWNEYTLDGVAYMLSGDLERDRKICERRTRKSQATRKKLGKLRETKHKNLALNVMVRPTPSIQWFLRNPDGKGLIYQEHVAHGIVDPEAAAANAEADNNWIYRQKFGDPAQAEADPLLDMDADVDDELPWSYGSSDQYAEPIGPDLPVTWKHQRKPRLAREEQIGTQILHLPHPTSEEAEAEDQPVSVSEDTQANVVYVTPDGVASPIEWRTTNSECRNEVLDWMLGQEQSETPPALSNQDYVDPRYLEVIEAQIGVARKQMDELQERIVSLAKARLVLEARCGRKHKYLCEWLDQPLPDEAEQTLPAELALHDVELVVERLPNSERIKGKPSAALRKYLQVRDGQEELQRERHREIVKRAKYAKRMRSMERQAAIRRRREIRSEKLKTIPAEVVALRRIGQRQRSLEHLRLHKQNQLAEFERDQVARRKADLYREQCFLRRVGNYKTSLKKRAKMAWLRFKTQESRRNAQNLLSNVRLESEPPSNVHTLPNRIPPVVESVRHESSLILPETKEIIFDSVTEQLMTAHMRRLIEHGVISRDELEAANEVFRQRAWQKFSSHHGIMVA